MENRWVMENADIIDIDELEKLESIRSKIKFSALSGFILGLFPQYTILCNPSFSKVKGIRKKIYLTCLIILPCLTAFLFSRPSEHSYKSYIRELQSTYDAQKSIDVSRSE